MPCKIGLDGTKIVFPSAPRSRFGCLGFSLHDEFVCIFIIFCLIVVLVTMLLIIIAVLLTVLVIYF